MPSTHGAPFGRRRFIAAGLAAICGCCLPLAGWASPPAYCQANRQRMLAEFAGVCGEVGQLLAPSTDRSGAVARDAMEAFAPMIEAMPEIGGEANRNQPYIVYAGWLAAISKAMKAQGLTAADAGRLYYDICLESLRSMPPSALAAAGEAFFSPEGYAATAAWAEWTHLRTYPGDWVATVWLGDGRDFDIGLNYSECGALKFFRSQGEEDVAPYFCINDFPRSSLQGTGLARENTLAQGGAVCDFRYKKGRPVAQSWETEAPKLKDRLKSAG
ncbi:L-2-amino-thiazoline-4-carboxylic acid hydrolase [Fundidesulfovibrio agrisoli]|uniref:L-2-amino-thiazoline-4-carboxylic acid hydrolase n=1 Tax=Fundidesulfovibrio agrisoli TaxID=2922717 RepID=UPI001FAE0ED5|nr:L-2-amino-thiazoline-4-carboxylic acid hydrolase [Fundidesulfovibrio agrisoli]